MAVWLSIYWLYIQEGVQSSPEITSSRLLHRVQSLYGYLRRHVGWWHSSHNTHWFLAYSQNGMFVCPMAFWINTATGNALSINAFLHAHRVTVSRTIIKRALVLLLHIWLTLSRTDTKVRTWSPVWVLSPSVPFHTPFPLFHLAFVLVFLCKAYPSIPLCVPPPLS